MLAHFKWIIGIQGAILHNFLSRPLYHRGLLWIMSLIQRNTDLPFRNQMADEHPRQGPGLVNPPGGDLHAFYAHQILVGPHMAD